MTLPPLPRVGPFLSPYFFVSENTFTIRGFVCFVVEFLFYPVVSLYGESTKRPHYIQPLVRPPSLSSVPFSLTLRLPAFLPLPLSPSFGFVFLSVSFRENLLSFFGFRSVSLFPPPLSVHPIRPGSSLTLPRSRVSFLLSPV